MKKSIILSLLLLISLIQPGCARLTYPTQYSINASFSKPDLIKRVDIMDKTTHINAASTIKYIIEHPAFAGFGQFILPLELGFDPDMPLSQVSKLLPYHLYLNPEEVTGTINHMIDYSTAGNKIFYDIYSAAEKQANARLASTGLFFFRGKPGAPFAIICPGGGFSYVGSIQEGFPIAIELAKKGYNAFFIQYRTGGADVACKDLATAISFVFNPAEEWQVGTAFYSLWGASAGARMAAYLGSYGPAAFSGGDLPRPCTVIMEYTGHTDYTVNDPPTFAIVGENDSIANPNTMKQRINALKNAGIDTEFHLIPGIGHGFGLGKGTPAEGWLEDAVDFWEAHQKAK